MGFGRVWCEFCASLALEKLTADPAAAGGSKIWQKKLLTDWPWGEHVLIYTMVLSTCVLGNVRNIHRVQYLVCMWMRGSSDILSLYIIPCTNSVWREAGQSLEDYGKYLVDQTQKQSPKSGFWLKLQPSLSIYMLLRMQLPNTSVGTLHAGFIAEFRFESRAWPGQ